MFVVFRMSYKKVKITDDITTCADIVRQRFQGVGGSLSGLELVQQVQPAGKATAVPVYNNTETNRFSCDPGEVIQNTTCCT